MPPNKTAFEPLDAETGEAALAQIDAMLAAEIGSRIRLVIQTRVRIEELESGNLGAFGLTGLSRKSTVDEQGISIITIRAMPANLTFLSGRRTELVRVLDQVKQAGGSLRVEEVPDDRLRPWTGLSPRAQDNEGGFAQKR